MAVSTGAVFGIIGGILGLAGIGYALTRPAAAATTSGGPPQPTPTKPPGGGTKVAWVRATQLNPGDHVRIALPAADLTTLAQSLGYTPDETGWENILAQPLVVRAFGYQSASAWAPGDVKLPADWPTDDTNAATEFHAEFIYGAPQALLLNASPIPIKAWTAKGLGG